MTTYSRADTLRHEKIAVLLDIASDLNMADVDILNRPAWTTRPMVGLAGNLYNAIRGILEGNGFTPSQSSTILSEYIQYGNECSGYTGAEVARCISRFLEAELRAQSNNACEAYD